MPNIWKSFLRPKAAPYQFPDTEELADEPEPAPEPEPEPGPGEAGGPDAADGGEEDRVPDVISFAQVQAEKILADARQQAEELRTQALAREVQAVVPRGEHIFFVSQGDDGSRWFLYTYEMYPWYLDYSGQAGRGGDCFFHPLIFEIRF